MSASIASKNTGRDNTTPTQKRLLMSINSSFFSSTSTVRGSSAMPHFGQLPGLSCTISGCIGQVYSVRLASCGTPMGSSAMPQIGQDPGRSSSTSGSIGQR